MRPKKRILLIDFVEDRRRELAFMLKCHGYDVRQAETAAEAKPSADVILAEVGANGDKLEALQRKAYCPLVLLAESDDAPIYDTSAAAVLKRDASRVDLLERIRIFVRRKRGPRPASARTGSVAA